MEKASFVGTYSVKENSGLPELWAKNFSSCCYAWRQENGNAIVLPLNRDGSPHSNCYLVNDEDFASFFQPHDATMASDGLASIAAPNTFVPKPPLRSDAPDLISMWHEQSLSSPAPVAPQALQENDDSPNSVTVSSLSHGEALFTPVWHPDDDEPPKTSETPSAPEVQMLTEEAQEDPESRSVRLEQHMRAKFEALLQTMDDQNPDPKLDEEMARLLILGTDFSWKQKFMFTEFGLALRRKSKLTLALASHLRALKLAPNDEHILFNVARAEYELRNPEKARYYLEKALLVAPDFIVAKNFQSFLLGRA